VVAIFSDDVISPFIRALVDDINRKSGREHTLDHVTCECVAWQRNITERLRLVFVGAAIRIKAAHVITETIILLKYIPIRPVDQMVQSARWLTAHVSVTI
jgi:hypothetical protein